MVNYTCNKCNKIFNHKWNYMRHINRKKPCVNNLQNGNGDGKLMRGNTVSNTVSNTIVLPSNTSNTKLFVKKKKRKY